MDHKGVQGFRDPSRLLAGTSKFYDSPAFSDISIVAPSGRKISCHQLVLAACSPKLAAVLDGGQLQGSTLPIQGVDSDALESVLRFCYTGECTFSVATAVPIYDAASKLLISSLSSACEQYVAQTLSPLNCCLYLSQALELDADLVIEACLKFASTRFEEVMQSDTFKACSQETLLHLLYSLRQRLSEQMLTQAVVRWVTVDSRRHHLLQSILERIGLPSLSQAPSRPTALQQLLGDRGSDDVRGGSEVGLKSGLAGLVGSQAQLQLLQQLNNGNASAQQQLQVLLHGLQLPGANGVMSLAGLQMLPGGNLSALNQQLSGLAGNAAAQSRGPSESGKGGEGAKSGRSGMLTLVGNSLQLEPAAAGARAPASLPAQAALRDGSSSRLAGKSRGANQAGGSTSNEDQETTERARPTDSGAGRRYPASDDNTSLPLHNTDEADDGAQAGMSQSPQSSGGEEAAVATEAVLLTVSANERRGFCIVEGCNADLSGLRDYHQRFRICDAHLKAASIMKDGLPQRFCQQCGRFHHVSEFDGNKRSCRARLQRHNLRRRKKMELTAQLHGEVGVLQQTPPASLNSSRAAAQVAAVDVAGSMALLPLQLLPNPGIAGRSQHPPSATAAYNNSSATIAWPHQQEQSAASSRMNLSADMHPNSRPDKPRPPAGASASKANQQRRSTHAATAGTDAVPAPSHTGRRTQIEQLEALARELDARAAAKREAKRKHQQDEYHDHVSVAAERERDAKRLAQSGHRVFDQPEQDARPPLHSQGELHMLMQLKHNEAERRMMLARLARLEEVEAADARQARSSDMKASEMRQPSGGSWSAAAAEQLLLLQQGLQEQATMEASARQDSEQHVYKDEPAEEDAAAADGGSVSQQTGDMEEAGVVEHETGQLVGRSSADMAEQHVGYQEWDGDRPGAGTGVDRGVLDDHDKQDEGEASERNDPTYNEDDDAATDSEHD